LEHGEGELLLCLKRGSGPKEILPFAILLLTHLSARYLKSTQGQKINNFFIETIEGSIDGHKKPNATINHLQIHNLHLVCTIIDFILKFRVEI
jgi:hypothetical protein